MNDYKIVYEIVEHNPNLFAVMSEVTHNSYWGMKTFKNFVAETETYEHAQNIVNKLEAMQ